jgi:hypothetical protein
MSYTSEELIYAAEMLLPALSPAMQESLSPLLARARKHERVDILIVDLLSDDEAASRWMRLALFSGQDELLYKGFERSAGNLGPIPANSIWVCPESDCDFRWRVLRAGRPVPPCPIHGCDLVPLEQLPEKASQKE